jgi:hypothetical protein
MTSLQNKLHGVWGEPRTGLLVYLYETQLVTKTRTAHRHGVQGDPATGFFIICPMKHL